MNTGLAALKETLKWLTSVSTELAVLREALKWLTSVGAGSLGFWLVEQASKRWEWVKGMESDIRYWFSLAVVGILAEGAYLAQVAMLYVDQPAGWRGWIEMSFFHIAGAALVAHSIHNQAVRRKKRLGLS